MGEKNAIDYLESLVSLRLHYFLCITNDTIVVTVQYICYNLNLLNSDSIYNLELSIITRIFADITNIWENIYKKALKRDQIDENIKFDNHPDFVYHLDKSPTFSKKLIFIIVKANFLNQNPLKF